MPEEPEEPIWTTSDGMEIPVSEMTDDHIRNAARLLARNIKNEMRWIRLFQHIASKRGFGTSMPSIPSPSSHTVRTMVEDNIKKGPKGPWD